MTASCVTRFQMHQVKAWTTDPRGASRPHLPCMVSPRALGDSPRPPPTEVGSGAPASGGPRELSSEPVSDDLAWAAPACPRCLPLRRGTREGGHLPDGPLGSSQPGRRPGLSFDFARRHWYCPPAWAAFGHPAPWRGPPVVCRPRSRWFSLPGAQPGVFQLPICFSNYSRGVPASDGLLFCTAGQG